MLLHLAPNFFSTYPFTRSIEFYFVCRVERSTDQVIKPVNLEALSKWVGKFPSSVVEEMAQLAPMLRILGYDPYANPPNYGIPDTFVVDNTQEVQRNQKWYDDKAQQVMAVSKKTTDTTRVNEVPEVQAAVSESEGTAL